MGELVSPPLRAPPPHTYVISSTELWFYQKHPRRTGATLGVIGGILVAPAALAYAGITSVGVATGISTFAVTKDP